MSNFACIGVAEEDAQRVLDHAAEHAESALESKRAEHLLWRDESGAALALHVEGNALACVTPFFAAEQPTRWRVNAAAASRDRECRHCSGADCDLGDGDGELVTRCAVQWLHFAPYERWLRRAGAFELEVVAFGASVRACADSAELQRAMAEAELVADEAGGAITGFADDFFLPTGLFGDGADGMLGRARALFGGRITACERRENRVTGGGFHQLRVATLPGAVDVVTAAVEGEPAPGAIALVEGWLVGRPVEPPPPPPRGLVSRLLGR